MEIVIYNSLTNILEVKPRRDRKRDFPVWTGEVSEAKGEKLFILKNIVDKAVREYNGEVKKVIK